jgi:hypothetical protein
LASISTPVATSTILSAAATNDSTLVGVQMDPGSYTIACTSAGCTGTGSPSFNQGAFSRLLYGDRTPVAGSFDCGVASPGRPGMCDFYPGLLPTQVRIEYIATGLGFWTRPGGAVPTIRVSIINRTFNFFFLSGLLGFTQISMPSMLSTVTGEDLSTTY